METRHFDRLTRALSKAGPRRGLLGLLAGLPVLGGLAALLDSEEMDAKGRRRRRMKAHKHGRGRRRKHRKNKKCQAQSTAETCAGKCGSVTNNCQKTVDCGSCACNPPCDACSVCNEATRTCVADPSQNGATCAGSGTATSVCCNGDCCAGCCGSDGSCGACRVFVTSLKYDGNLKGSSASGLAGADDKCQQLADSVDPPLPGAYKAWLSDSTASPSTRFRCTAANCSTEGYVLVDGVTVVASDWADLTTCDSGNGPCLDHVIDHTEQNALIGSQNDIWTHTNTDGTAGGAGNVHCLDWSSNDPGQSGDMGTPIAGHGDATWTRFITRLCPGTSVNGARLYCFQQD